MLPLIRNLLNKLDAAVSPHRRKNNSIREGQEND
jgi:hypothetical protein